MDHRQHVLDYRQYTTEIALRWHRLACKIARGYAKTFGMQGDVDDMCAEAYLACVQAAESYDPARGFKFCTYAGKSVAYRMINYCRNRAAMGFTAFPRSDRHCETPRHIRTYYARTDSGESFDAPLVERLLSPEQPQYGDEPTADEVRSAIEACLTPREARVIDQRFSKGMTLEQIGRLTSRRAPAVGVRTGSRMLNGVTKESVRVTQNQALQKLREWLADD